jgi:hypothetical protein
MTERVGMDRLRELSAVEGGRHGGVLMDAALVREMAREIVEARMSAATDDPALDGTDGAHPAWWRGHAVAESRMARALSGAQHREREARNEVAVLRARLDALIHREMSAVAQRDALARLFADVGQALGVDHAGDIPEALHRSLADRDEDDARAREGFDAFRAQVRQERAQGDAGDLAGLGRRERGR